MDRLLMEKVGKKFYGHDTLKSKYEPQIPASAEREYVRTVDTYMKILKTELEDQFWKLKEVYKTNRDWEVRVNHRNDSATDFILSISQIFTTIKNNIIAKTVGFGLRHKLESLAHLNRKLTVKEWKKAIKATLGIDIREDYYLGDFYIEQLQKWVDENVRLISSIPENTLEKMKDIVYEGFSNGKTTTRMVKEIQQTYHVGRKKAELIARDQTAKLNGQIQRAQQQDAGITEYIWSTTGDERVRRSHRELNGKKFRWDDPPENSDGRKCHPGQDFQCRCIGRPIFNKSTLNLPLEDEEEKVQKRTNHNFGDSEAKDRFGIFTNNNKGNEDYYDFKGKTITVVEHELSQRKHETGVCFDENGKAIFAQLGNEDSISFTKIQCKQMVGKIVTHNHPLGTPPSPEDLYILKRNKAKELRTCGKKGTYVLKYTEQIEKLPEFQIFSDEYDNLIAELASKYKNKVRSGMNERDALALLGEEVWRELCTKYGISLEFEKR